MKQLVQPDLSVTGRIGWCLLYSAKVFHCTGVAPYAWTAWQQAKYKHTDSIPGDVAVPCWFSFWEGGINQGHVVVSVPGKGFYSSPWRTGTDHAVLGSIAEVERIYGAKYVGWSEDILGLRVVNNEGAGMATISDAEYADLKQWKATFQPVAFTETWKKAGGQPGSPKPDVHGSFNAILADDAMYADWVKSTPAWQAANADLSKLDVVPKGGSSDATELKPGIYEVK